MWMFLKSGESTRCSWKSANTEANELYSGRERQRQEARTSESSSLQRVMNTADSAGPGSFEIAKAVNYSTHAIEDFRRLAGAMRSRAPGYSRTFSHLADMLTRAVKFLLPNRCELLDPAAIGQPHLDLLKLPYPCVALEASWYGDENVENLWGEQLGSATKRIALCWEAGADPEPVQGLEGLLAHYPDGGVFVLPVYKAESQPTWIASHGFVFVPYENTVTPWLPEMMTAASRIAADEKAGAGQIMKWSKSWTVEPFVLIPESWPELIAHYGSKDRVLASIMNNAHDEVLMVVQACAVLNCANVIETELQPPAKLNKNRRARGKAPFFTYKVLSVDASPSQQGRREQGGGTHASPRMHLRRGHLRRIPEGRMVWVRPTMVGSHGLVDKDYRIRPAQG